MANRPIPRFEFFTEVSIMSSDVDSIGSLQEQLQSMLGENYSRYLEIMQDWFGQRTTKEFFDYQLSVLLKDGALKVHNEMMKQIILHCTNPQPQQSTSVAAADSASSAIGNSNNKSQTITSNAHYYPKGRVILQSSDGTGRDEPGNTTRNTVAVLSQQTNGNGDDGFSEQYKTQLEPVDWLYKVDLVKATPDTIIQVPSRPSSKKFPPAFANQSQQLKISVNNNGTPDVVLNVTHAYDIADRLSKLPNLKPHFKRPVHENQPYLSIGPSLYGRFTLKAWEIGVDAVDPQAMSIVAESVKEHIRRLVTEIVKQRKAFRMRNDRVCHSLGSPYPNPYLLQGQQLFDAPYCSDSTKMADVMQIPTLLPTADEQERVACLQISSAAPAKNCRFPSNRATLADLRNVIEMDPGIIPASNLRFAMMSKIHQKYKGWGGTFSEDEEEEGELLPTCSY